MAQRHRAFFIELESNSMTQAQMKRWGVGALISAITVAAVFRIPQLRTFVVGS